MNISQVLVRTFAATAAIVLLAGCAASGTASTAASTAAATAGTTDGTSNGTTPSVSQDPGDPIVSTQDLPGPTIESTQVAIGHGSFAGGLGTDRTSARRIATPEDLETFLADYKGQDGTLVISDDEIAQAKDALARGRVLAGGIFHSGCFPAGGPELVNADNAVTMVATFTDPQEGTVACYVAVSTVALLSLAPADLPLGLLPAVGEQVPTSSQPTREPTPSPQEPTSTPEPLPSTNDTPALTPQETTPGGPTQAPPTLPGPEIDSTQVAIGSGSFRGASSDQQRGPYRITDADQLARFNALYLGANDSGLLTGDQLASAQKALKAGSVLVGAMIHTGCFPAGKPTLAHDGDTLALVAMEIDPQEGMVDCYVAIGTVAVVAVNGTDVPAGSIASAADL